jgi:site-specific recombinase XerD
MTSELRADLLARAHASGYIFGEGDAGLPPTQANVSMRIARLFKTWSFTGVSHHTFRHTGVTWLLEQGINPRAIQSIAGWTSLRMLEKYGHVRDAELQRAACGNAVHLLTVRQAESRHSALRT